MTVTNHALTGGLVAVLIANPAAALPLAFASHFLLDSLPHFGNHPKMGIGTDLFRRYLFLDIALMLTVAFVMALMFSHVWWLVLLCAALAVSPDLMWYPHWRAARKGEAKQPGPVARFHKKIQWAEIPEGWKIELAYFVVTAAFLLHMVVC